MILKKWFLFSFELADDKRSFNTSCNNIFLDFWFLVSILLIKLQEEFHRIKYYLCWICTSNKDNALKTIRFSFSAFCWNLLRSKFWNHFQAEIIPSSPNFLEYFPTVFHMVWKNQEEFWILVSWVFG